jgi:hypothetical protein
MSVSSNLGIHEPVKAEASELKKQSSSVSAGSNSSCSTTNITKRPRRITMAGMIFDVSEQFWYKIF